MRTGNQYRVEAQFCPLAAREERSSRRQVYPRHNTSIRLPGTGQWSRGDEYRGEADSIRHIRSISFFVYHTGEEKKGVGY